MNRQINPDHCYDTEDGMYMLRPRARWTDAEWLRHHEDGRSYQTFTSLAAAKGWLEHVLEHGEQGKPVIVAGGVSAEFKAKFAAALNRGRK